MARDVVSATRRRPIASGSSTIDGRVRGGIGERACATRSIVSSRSPERAIRPRRSRERRASCAAAGLDGATDRARHRRPAHASGSTSRRFADAQLVALRADDRAAAESRRHARRSAPRALDAARRRRGALPVARFDDVPHHAQRAHVRARHGGAERRSRRARVAAGARLGGRHRRARARRAAQATTCGTSRCGSVRRRASTRFAGGRPVREERDRRAAHDGARRRRATTSRSSAPTSCRRFPRSSSRRSIPFDSVRRIARSSAREFRGASARGAPAKPPCAAPDSTA